MAKKNVSLLVSAAGWIAGLVEKLVIALRERGITDEEIHSLVTEKGDVLIGRIADAITEFVKQAKKIIYSIVIDYGKSIEEMVRLGKYDRASDVITSKHFPTKRTGKAEFEIKLFHFDRNISSEDAIKEMDEKGYRPAECCELLAFGAKYPDVQREFLIVALGSAWQDRFDRRVVAVLLGGVSWRDLYMDNFDGGWDGRYRFAAVRK